MLAALEECSRTGARYDRAPPTRRPHPPGLVGGTGERKTLRLVAWYANACNLFDVPDGGRTVKHQLEVLARALPGARPALPGGREDAEHPAGGRRVRRGVRRRCQAAAAWGIQHTVVIVTGPWTEGALATLAEGIPKLQQATS
jgi:hypothetical protein